ncbi:hypothetical protein pb186bvf_017559 [Paramecium bursaria]
MTDQVNIQEFFTSRRSKQSICSDLSKYEIKELIQVAIQILETQSIMQEELILLKHIFKPFQFFNQNDQELTDILIKKLRIERFNQYDIVFEKGDSSQKCFFMLEGRVSIYKIEPSKTQDLEQTQKGNRRHSQSYDYTRETLNFKQNKIIDKRLQQMVKTQVMIYGQMFGEQALTDIRQRPYTVYCETNCCFAVLSKMEYIDALQAQEKLKHAKNMNNIRNNPYFTCIPKRVLINILYIFEAICFQYRQFVYNQGQINNGYIYIVKEGEFRIYQKQNDDVLANSKIQDVALIEAGALFGEEAFIGQRRESCIQCNSEQGIIVQEKLNQSGDQMLFEIFKQNCLKKKLMFSRMKEDHIVKFERKSKSNQQNHTSPDNHNPSLNTSYDFHEAQNKSKNQQLPSLQSNTKKSKALDSDYTQQINGQFNFIIDMKRQIMNKILNVQNNQQDLQQVQQKTIMVQVPKNIVSQINTQRWPIKACLYLNDIDKVSVRKSQSLIPRCETPDDSVYSKRKLQNMNKKNKIDILQRVLINQRKYKTKTRRRAITLSYRKYMDKNNPSSPDTTLLLF